MKRGASTFWAVSSVVTYSLMMVVSLSGCPYKVALSLSLVILFCGSILNLLRSKK